MKSKKIEVTEIAIADLVSDDKNANMHTEAGDKLTYKSISELGLLRSGGVDANNMLIAGNGVKKQALLAGKTKALIVDIDEDTWVVTRRKDLDLNDPGESGRKARQMALVDNASALAGIEFDIEAVQEIEEQWGFEAVDWGVEFPEEETVAPAAEEDNFNPIDGVETDIVLGDIFEIQKEGISHRLMCGDSTDSDLVEKLMGGKIADLVFTDPDFAMPIETMLEVYDTSLIYSKGIGFWLGGDKQVVKLANHDFDNFAKCFVQDFRNATIVSNDQPMTRTVLIAQMGRKKMNNLHDAFSTLLQIPTDRVGEQHKLTPMSKKVELPFEFISHFTDAGDLVLDLFGHSGSTMVAATQLKRSCYMMELMPKYCQVILDRMKALDSEIKIIKNGVPLA